MAATVPERGRPGVRTRLPDRGSHLRRDRGGSRRLRLRAVVAAARPAWHRLHHQRCSRPLPHGRAQGGISARSATWARRLALAHVRHRQGSDWLGDQDSIEYLCRNAPPPCTSSSIGRAVRAHRGRQDYPAPVRRHDHPLRQGHRAAHLRGRRPHGHAMLHTSMAPRSSMRPEFLVEYFVIDLIMDDEGRCCGVVALQISTTAAIHRFRAQMTILATGGYGRAYFSCTSAHICTGDGNAMCCAPGCRCRTWSSSSSHRPGVYGAGVLITKARAARAAILPTRKAKRFMSATTPSPRISPRATWSRAP